MLTFLGLIVAMILIGMFWRVILPVALIGVACIVVVLILIVGGMELHQHWPGQTKQAADPDVVRCMAAYKDEASRAQQTANQINCVLAAKKATN